MASNAWVPPGVNETRRLRRRRDGRDSCKRVRGVRKKGTRGNRGDRESFGTEGSRAREASQCALVHGTAENPERRIDRRHRRDHPEWPPSSAGRLRLGAREACLLRDSGRSHPAGRGRDDRRGAFEPADSHGRAGDAVRRRLPARARRPRPGSSGSLGSSWRGASPGHIGPRNDRDRSASTANRSSSSRFTISTSRTGSWAGRARSWRTACRVRAGSRSMRWSRWNIGVGVPSSRDLR